MPDFSSDNTRDFFIGANTCAGFTFCAEEDLRAIERVYVIKGGPGTGKSTLIKKAAGLARSRGEAVTVYRCSSDPDSLDAVVLEGRSVALVDGTSPHIYEPLCPGAVESILDTGAFWNTSMLKTKRDEIISLNKEKNRLFASTYRYLSNASSLIREEDALTEGYFLKDKAKAAIGRLLNNNGGGFSVKNKQTTAFSTEGRIRLNTYAELSAITYTVADSHGTAPRLMNTVLDVARERGLEAWVSRDPYLRPEEIYLPECGIAFVTDGGKKVINCQRFTDPDAYRSVRRRYRFVKGLREALHSCAEDELKDVRAVHFALEDIYRETMDLPSLSLMTEAFLSEIFA